MSTAVILTGNYRFDTPCCLVDTDEANGQFVDYFNETTADGTPAYVREGKISRNKKYFPWNSKEDGIEFAIEYHHGDRTYYKL